MPIIKGYISATVTERDYYSFNRMGGDDNKLVLHITDYIDEDLGFNIIFPDQTSMIEFANKVLAYAENPY